LANFGSRFRELRHALGLTQAQLVADFNCRYHFHYSKAAISQYENGKRIPEIDALQAFADFFGVSLDYLLGRTDTRNYPEVPLVTFIDYLPNDLKEYVLAHRDDQWIELAADMKNYELTPQDISDLIHLVARLKLLNDKTSESK
jgi:transcriptional regulator with XRE-family HTH domain